MKPVVSTAYAVIGAASGMQQLVQEEALMKLDHPSLKKRRPSKHVMRPRPEVPSCTQAEELYWFAMALTGNAEFAAKLVVEAGSQVSAGRGILHG